MGETLSTEQIQVLLDRSPFIKFLNVHVVSVDPAREEIVITMPMRPELERRPGSGQFHGGAIAALIDIVGDYVLVMLLRIPVPTIDFRVDYLRPAIQTHLTGIGRLRRAGRTIGVVDVDVHDDAGRLIAVGRGCYSTAMQETQREA